MYKHFFQKVLSKASEFKDYLTMCSSAPSELMSLMCLRRRQDVLNRLKEIIEKNLTAADQFFGEYSEIFEWKRPVAGTTAFVGVKGWLSELGKGGATGFADALRINKQVLIVPGALFQFSDKYFRLGYGRRNVVEIFEHLREFVDENKP